MMVQPISRRTVADEVATSLRSRILSGALLADAPLRQDAIAAELGVSRIPVREALAQLEGEGLVRLEAHRGAFVVGLSDVEVGELYDLRAAIEPLLLRHAIPHMTTADLAAADRARADFDRAVAAGEAEHWGELNWQFHAALYRPAGRARTLRLAQDLHNNTYRYIRVHLALQGTPLLAGEDHRRLVELSRAGDIPAAEALVVRHIRDAQAALAAWIARRSAAGER